MKILIFIDHFESGGAARVTSILCQGLAAKGHEIVLALNNETRKVFYPTGEGIHIVSNYVKRHGNGHLAGIRLLIDRCIKYREIIRKEKPAIVFGVEPEPYLHAWIGALGTHIPVIANDHTSYQRKQHWFTRFIRWTAYDWADKVSILSRADYQLLGKKIRNKVVVYNPLSYDILQTNPAREKKILVVGRIDEWNKAKGFDIMLRVWSQLAPQYPEWTLEIAGGGSAKQEQAMLNYIEELGITKQTHFCGVIKDMQTKYQQSAIFAMPSRMEGFSMSLLEAASQGCACIAFELFGTTHEIFDAEGGICIADGDENAFAAGLQNLLDSEDKRNRYSQNIRKQVERFTIDKYIDQWEQICTQLVKPS